MTYKHEECENYTIVYLEGQYIGGEETDKLSEFLKSFRKQNKLKLILDMESVTYLSSIVIGLFVKVSNDFYDEGGKLAFINVNKAIMEVFKITHVDSNLHIFSSLDDAVVFMEKTKH